MTRSLLSWFVPADPDVEELRGLPPGQFAARMAWVWDLTARSRAISAVLSAACGVVLLGARLLWPGWPGSLLLLAAGFEVWVTGRSWAGRQRARAMAARFRAEAAGAIEACPTPVFHETHRYCPSCPWIEAG